MLVLLQDKTVDAYLQGRNTLHVHYDPLANSRILIRSAGREGQEGEPTSPLNGVLANDAQSQGEHDNYGISLLFVIGDSYNYAEQIEDAFVEISILAIADHIDKRLHDRKAKLV